MKAVEGRNAVMGLFFLVQGSVVVGPKPQATREVAHEDTEIFANLLSTDQTETANRTSVRQADYHLTEFRPTHILSARFGFPTNYRQ